MSDLTGRLEEKLRPHCGISWSLVTAEEITPFIELELLRARLEEHKLSCHWCIENETNAAHYCCPRLADLERQIREREG